MITFQGNKSSDKVEFIPGMEGWFDLRQPKCDWLSLWTNGKNPVIHFMDAKNTADNIKYLFLIFRTSADKIGSSPKPESSLML